MKLKLLGVVLAIDANSACYKVNVPEATASGSQQDIYFQIEGPSSLQWIGLGQGNRMKDSNIFMIYADDSGTNVTLSPRSGTGEQEPNFNQNAKVSLLEGSGIANGKMTANVRCSSCADWGAGSMDFTSSNTQWIWAVKGGPPVKSSSPSYSGLRHHDSSGSLTFDLTVAKGGNSLNPFATQAATSGTASSASSPTSSASSGSGNTGASTSFDNIRQKRERATIAHGAVMGLAFALLFPLGSILIRVFSFSGLIWVHAATQMVAYALAIAGLGLGVWIALNPFRMIDHRHPILGLIVISLLVIQPFLGMVHHNVFKRTNQRSFWSTAHVWYGRVLITIGIINGGLGLELSDNTTKGEIGYGVVAGIMWVTWMAVAVRNDLKSGSRRGGDSGEMALESKGGSEDRIKGHSRDGVA
ncbi:hypothetical protein MMC07_002174 [Pseudocyphellaria aurata]|nr:hypothetical protein [Pseudocyphellaria aurata]